MKNRARLKRSQQLDLPSASGSTVQAKQKGGANMAATITPSCQIICDLDHCFACRKWFTKGEVERRAPRQGFPRLLGSARKHRDSEGQLQKEETRKQAPFFGARWRLGTKPECALRFSTHRPATVGSTLQPAAASEKMWLCTSFELNRTLDIAGRLGGAPKPLGTGSTTSWLG
jgi:hypothetical protein